MRVLKFCPHAWFFLENEGIYYLDVLCESNVAPVGYSLLMQLNIQEVADFTAKGKASIAELADKIASNPPRFQTRNIQDQDILKAVDAAISANAPATSA